MASHLFRPKSGRKYGLQTYCQVCTRAVASVHTKRTDEEIDQDRSKTRPNNTKICYSCREYKALNMFTVSRTRLDGLQDTCKECSKERTIAPEKIKEYRKKHRLALSNRSNEEISIDQLKLRPTGTKVCRKCRESKPLCNFSVKRNEKDGLRTTCKQCDIMLSRYYGKKVYIDYWTINEIPLECYVCGGKWTEVDHVIASSRGGSDDPCNRLPICKPCNSSKNANPLEEWLIVKHPDKIDDILYKVSTLYNVNY